MKKKTCANKEKCVNPKNPQLIENFYVHPGKKDGLYAKCKSCIKNHQHKKRLQPDGKFKSPKKRVAGGKVDVKDCSAFKRGKCASAINPQPIENFHPQKGRINGRSQCISCENEYTRQNSEKKSARSRKWHSQNKERKRNTNYNKLYGISLEEWNVMFKNQNGRCFLCEKEGSLFKQGLHVDHCHKSQKIRALLCQKCNRALGLMNDDSALMRRSADYVDFHKG